MIPYHHHREQCLRTESISVTWKQQTYDKVQLKQNFVFSFFHVLSIDTLRFLFKTTACFHLFGNRLGKALSWFNMTVSLCTKHGLSRYCLSSLVCFSVLEESDQPEQSPDLNPIQHPWDDRLASSPAISSQPLMVQSLVENLHRGVKAVVLFWYLYLDVPLSQTVINVTKLMCHL